MSRSSRGDQLDVVHAVVHEVDLAAALQLARDRFAHEVVVELGHVRLDRQPVLRRRLDRRHVADARERHVQRARDRRRRQRQHVDLAAHLLQPLLVRDAEALLLVDDDQPEVLERDVLLQQPVRADDDVDLAGCGVGDDAPLLAGRCGSGRASRRCTGKPPSRSRNVVKCCCASTVVGTSTATCLPSITALKAARMATSVLP